MFFSEKARKRRLRSANGVPSWKGYQFFRPPIYAFSWLFAKVCVLGYANLPYPEGVKPALDFYNNPYERIGKQSIGTKGVIISPSHGSVLDISSIHGPLRRPMTIVGKAPFAMVWPFGSLFQHMGLVPIERSKDSRSKLPGPLGWFMIKWRKAVTYKTAEMLSVLDDSLARGVPAVMFATGSRSQKQTKYGPFLASFRTGAPVVPVAIIGCKKGDAVRFGLLRRRLVVVSIGEPIYPPYVRAGEIPSEDLEEMLKKWEEATNGELSKQARELRSAWRDEYRR
jgi:1-acyl-sn-glycerol-3-phosphate acyltransferase